MGYKERICHHCGRTYKPHAPNQQYCSDTECKRWNRNRINREARQHPEKEVRCVVCGDLFVTRKWKQQQCCGEECSHKAKLNYGNHYYRTVLKSRKGHLDRGHSYPQKHIFDTVVQLFPNLVWKYDDRSTLRNPSTGYPLELDIWCPDKYFAIEYDGEHHFSPKQYGQKTLDYVRFLDSVKTEECAKANIILLRISCQDDWRNKEWLVQKVGECLNGVHQVR